MKMAKPSAQDVKAAEELLHVLQLIAAWGGPWPNPAAGENLCELLNNGETAFDYANTTHLQTLYNNLARLQRTACPARVISGMCHVIMYEKNEILDPESDCIDLHPRFAQAQAQIEQLQAECQTLRGLQPAPPPRPPEGEGLPRYGLRWNGPGQPLSVPMDDGYWTPWHLAATAVVMPDTDCEWCAGAGHDSYGDKCAHCINPARGVPEGKEFSQFLSAVMDAAGLVRHGRQSKELSEYLGGKCMEYMLSATPTQPDQCAHDLTMVKAGEA